MAQQTIKALYTQPITYKLIKDGYKTVTETFNARDGMPKVMELDPPEVTYTTDMTYTTDNTLECAPLVTFSEFTTPDDQTCASATYVCAPANTTYACQVPVTSKVQHFTIIGSPTINNGIANNFTVSNRLQLTNMPTYSAGTIDSFELQFKVHTPSDENWTTYGRLLNDYNSFDGFVLEFPNSNNRKAVFKYGAADFTADNMTGLPDTDYWIRVTYDGTTMLILYSLDGIDYTQANSREVAKSSFGITTSTIDIGARYYGDQNPQCNWNGSIDLTESYIKINGEYYWIPYTEVTDIQTKYFPGLLDVNAGNYDPTQATEYKLYQLHRGTNNDVLRLTKTSLTDPNSLYNQYISQVTLPTQDIKWYYKGEPQSVETRFYNSGCSISSNHVASGFSPNNVLYLMLYDSYESYSSLVLNIETGDMLQDCGIISYINYYTDQSGVVLGLQNKFDGGKLLINSRVSPGFTNGVTTLQPNTKYWIGITKNTTRTLIYILQDNGIYTKETLPNFTSWSREGIIPLTTSTYDYGWEGTFGSLGLTGAKVYDSEGTLISSDGDFYFAGGKLYLDDTYENHGPYPSYSDVIWQPYYYYDYQYWWCANRSVYTYLEHENYADYLDFSDSYVNVTDNSYHRYLNPQVCLMPIDGGETITEYQINGSVTGILNFNSETGKLSGFSSMDYLSLPQPFNPGENSWEMVFKITTGSDVQTWQEIFHSSISPNNDGRYGVSILIDSGSFELDISIDGTSWAGTDHGSLTLSTNSNYYVKVGRSLGEYYLEYSVDGITYTRDITYTLSDDLPSLTNSWIGIYRNAAFVYPLFGSIDLSESYIKIDNTIWWNGALETQKEHHYILQKAKPNISNYETATVNDGVISNITDTMKTNELTIYKNQSFEIFGKITTGSNISGIQEIFTDFGSNLFLLRNSGSYWNVCYYVNGQWQQTTNGGFYADTSYYVRLRYFPSATTKDGFSYSAKTVYFEYLKKGDSSWTRDFSYSLSTYFFGDNSSVTEQTFSMTVGSQHGTELWKGSIDLNQCYVKVNDQIVWQGMKPMQALPGCIYSFTDDGTEQDWDVYYKNDYSQPVLVNAGGTYLDGTKVDTIHLPAHKIWSYQSGGIWTPGNSSD